MPALICGSFAYDNIMVFQDRFKNHILPDKIHILNVSFLVPELRREFGGCAGNIAYNLKMIGGDPLPMGTVGRDFAPYAQWMDEQGIERRCVRELDDTLTAQAFITTDLDDNQITAFHPGAMEQSALNAVVDAGAVSIGIIAPDGREGMIRHAEQMKASGIPFIFDPGQGMPMFDGEDLKRFIDDATWVTVNDYESELMQERTGLSPGEIAEHVLALVVTRGGEGSHIYMDGKRLEIPTAPPREIKDPTGCGDAYRAGLLYGLMHDLPWETTARIASLLGAIKIENAGTQNHRVTRDEFAERYRSSFGMSFEW
ncbi:MAG: carbohydrate kinase family protein [Gammaproteobacteria bacterium]|nr:carbohydrate kinase family protein [Gammaproteobacteria bacterium]